MKNEKMSAVPLFGKRRSELPPTEAVSFSLTHPAQFVTETSDSTRTHIHGCYEMYVYLSGDVGFVVQDRIYSLAPGDAIVTGANTYHHSIVRTSCLHEHFCLLFDTEDPEVRELLDDLTKQTHLHFDEKGRGKFLRLLSDLEEATEGERSALSVRGAFYALFAFLEKSRNELNEERPTEAYPKPLSDILRYVGEHYADLQSAAEIAGHFYISIASLERLFAKHLRITPYRYLLGIRLAAAKRLLDDGENVTQTAIQTGFGDCSHFIQRFKQEFGITPNRYRRR